MPKPKTSTHKIQNSEPKTRDTKHATHLPTAQGPKLTVKGRALFIGRFQPFHNGHLHTVRKLLKKNGELIIAIGSAEAECSFENPFTAGERIEMIRSCFSKNELARMIIIPIRDINNHALWVSHVKNYVPEFEHLYSNNELVRRLFHEAGFDVHALWFFRKELHTGRIIRGKIAEGKKWQDSVPKNVAEIMKKLEIGKRLRK